MVVFLFVFPFLFSGVFAAQTVVSVAETPLFRSNNSDGSRLSAGFGDDNGRRLRHFGCQQVEFRIDLHCRPAADLFETLLDADGREYLPVFHQFAVEEAYLHAKFDDFLH